MGKNQQSFFFSRSKMAGNTGIGKMHMELYTNNAPLTQKAKFWCNYVSSLKGEKALSLHMERDANCKELTLG